MSPKAFQREWSGVAAETPRPRAGGVDDYVSTDFATFCSDSAYD